MNVTEKILFLGTGHATVTRCYNTCFILKCGDYSLLVDGGGGNTILNNLTASGVALSDISGIFVTHTHIDHLLGILWILRMIGEDSLEGKYSGSCIVYGSNDTLNVIDYICRHTFSSAVLHSMLQRVTLYKTSHLDKVELDTKFSLMPIEVGEIVGQQLGFKATMPSGKVLVCLGDTPCKEQHILFASGADWLLCEAFCLDKDKPRYHPNNLGHETVIDAATFAEKANVKNLILYHTNDFCLSERKITYTEEARTKYSGKIYVPDDLECIICK